MSQKTNTLALAHRFIKEHLSQGGFAIDATMGRGNDTAFLCRLVGPQGHVLALDIQQEALDSTKTLLSSEGLLDRAQLILDCHSHMNLYTSPGSVDAIIFNFGYLPGGNHQIGTKAATSISALEQGFHLLKKDGIMSLCIYYGGDSGFDEKNALMVYLKSLDFRKYTVMVTDFYNRPNNPPIFVAITKDAD